MQSLTRGPGFVGSPCLALRNTAVDIARHLIRLWVLACILPIALLHSTGKPQNARGPQSCDRFSVPGNSSAVVSKEKLSPSLLTATTLGEVSNGCMDSSKVDSARRSVLRNVTAEPQVLTRDIYTQLNNLPFPKPTGQFVMDGRLDTSAILVASHGGIHLYAAVRGSQLYVATNSARSQRADMFVFVSVAPGELRDAPLGKTGRVAAWSAFLGDRYADTSARWYDASASPLMNIVDGRVGTVLEGVVDFEYLTGVTPDALYLAVGKYRRGDRGRLVAKLPVGKNNGDISFKEFYRLTVSGTN